MGVVVVVAAVLSSGSTPRTGTSDTRLFALAGKLECLQCVGENVASSQAPLAVQSRQEIRTQMRKGATDDEILNYFAARYGKEILLTPPKSGLGSVVWMLPVLVLAGAVMLLVRAFQRWRLADDAPAASAEDRDLVAGALADRGAPGPGTGT